MIFHSWESFLKVSPTATRCVAVAEAGIKACCEAWLNGRPGEGSMAGA